MCQLTAFIEAAVSVLLDCLANDFCFHLRTVRTNIKLGKAILETDILCLQKCLCSSVPVIQSRPKISCLYSVSSSTTFIYKYLMINNCNAKRSLEHHSEKLYKVYGNVGLWHNEIGKKQLHPKSVSCLHPRHYNKGNRFYFQEGFTCLRSKG